MTQSELLSELKGVKVQSDSGTIYTVVDVRFFNGSVSTIGLKDDNNVVKYATADCYLSMADVA